MFRLLRRWFTEQSTIGELYNDRTYLCLTLEDRIRAPGVKVHGQTAIPPGVYHLAMTDSLRFGKMMPQILYVPGFEGVRIHSGNVAGDTDGCVLLGVTRSIDSIGESRAAYAEFLPILKAALAASPVTTIEISNIDPPVELLR